MGLDQSGLLPAPSTVIDRYWGKNYGEDAEQTLRDYKKFRTDTKITVVGEEGRQ